MNSKHNLLNQNLETETLQIMKRSLLKSFQKLQGVERCGILFSGGVDSSLAAMLTARFCDDVILLSSCTEDSRDSLTVSRASEILNMKLVESRMSSESVWNALPEVIHAIDRCRRMDVEIALPFFHSSREAKKRGIDNIVSGQGPDELFAGYARHVDIFKDEGEKALQKLLFDEVSKTHEANIERDERVIASSGVTVYFPYLDTEFVRVALSIPAGWKVEPDMNPERKVIFRKLAINMGLPAELAMKPKDATQYSSGSSRILIDSVRDHILNYESIIRKKASILVQDVLNIIASEIGLSITQPLNPKLDIDLKPTKDFVRKLESTSHQQ